MEVNDITPNENLDNKYKALGKKLRQFEEEATTEVHRKLSKGLNKVSSKSYLPEDLVVYILSQKRELKMAESILPESFFKRPSFLGKEDFYYRLASELISFGLAFQRVYLKPIKLSKLAELFHQYRPWWKCDIQDIERVMNSLNEKKIIEHTSEGYIFEPLVLSRDVHDFLALIAVGINEYGEISLSSIYKLVSWNHVKINSTLDLLTANRVCIFDRSKETLYFPELKKGL